MSDTERESLLSEVERLVRENDLQCRDTFPLTEALWLGRTAAPKLAAECRRLAGDVTAMREALELSEIANRNAHTVIRDNLKGFEPDLRLLAQAHEAASVASRSLPLSPAADRGSKSPE